MELRVDKNFIEHLKMAVKKRLKETEKPDVSSNGSEDNLPAKDQNCLRHGGYPGSTQVANITPGVVKDTLEKPVLTNPPIDNGWSIKTSSSNIPSDGNGNGNILPSGSNGDILPSDITGDLG